MKLSTTLAATALAVATALAPSTAHAAILHVDDPAGDLDHGADLTRVTVKHAKLVRVRLQHVDLRPSPNRAPSAVVFIDTRKDLPGPEYALSTGLFSGTDYALTATDGFKPVDKRIDCRHSLQLDYLDDVTRIWFARGCFKRPAEVRVAVKVAAEAKATDEGTVVDWMTKRRAFTPWVAKG